MNSYPLIPFAISSPHHSVSVGVTNHPNSLSLEYALIGPISEIEVPKLSSRPMRKVGLYQTTCFEAFIGNDKGEYLEWNFSPSQDWCVFDFESYRVSSKRELNENFFHDLKVHFGTSDLKLDVSLKLDEIRKTLGGSETLKLGLSAVVETVDGTLQYFSLKHATDKPDFHRSGSFLIDLV